MEKMAYAVVMAARKLRHYFQSFKIKVPTTFPLRDMFENREASGRIGKWATLLHRTPLTLSHEAQSSHKSWQISLWLDTINTFAEPSGHRSHLVVGMWRSLLQEWFRCFSNSHSSFVNSTQVRSKVRFSRVYKQCRRIRRPASRSSQGKGTWCEEVVHQVWLWIDHKPHRQDIQRT